MTFYSTALLLTLVAELPLVFFLMGRRRGGAILAHAFLLNLFTHPLVYFAIQTDLVSFTTGEIAVILTEAIGYWLLSLLEFRRALAISLVANLATILLSLVL